MKPLAALLLTAATATLHAAPFSATDWPRFLGPTGAAIATDSKAPVKWGDKENIAWKADMPGPGSSSPIVFGDKVFVTCWTGYGDQQGANDMSQLTRHLICLDRATGKQLWDAKVPSAATEDPWQGFITEHGYATHTPVTDGERVYVFFGKSGALAFDMQGKQLWQTSCGTSSGDRRWGSGASPILIGNVLIVNASDESQTIFGLDKNTGKILWQAGGQFGMAYGTPTAYQHDGVTDLMIAVPQELWGMNPETGGLRWYATHGLSGNVSPSVIPGGDTAYIFGGYPATRSTAIKLGGKGDLGEKALLWSSNTSSYVPTPVLKDGYLYVVNDQGFATCMNATTGEDVYRERVMEGSGGGGGGGNGGGPGGGGGGGGRRGGGKPFYASPVLVGDKLVCVSRKNGTYILAAKPKFEVLGHNVISSDSSQFNATPAVSGNLLLLRSDKAVYGIGMK